MDAGRFRVVFGSPVRNGVWPPASHPPQCCDPNSKIVKFGFRSRGGASRKVNANFKHGNDVSQLHTRHLFNYTGDFPYKTNASSGKCPKWSKRITGCFLAEEWARRTIVIRAWWKGAKPPKFGIPPLVSRVFQTPRFSEKKARFAQFLGF